MRAAVSWYKNISKINKEEAFTHAHAVHRSYGRGTLPDLIEKNCYIDVGYELTQGEFSPLGDGENVTSKQKICRKVDLSRGKIIKIFYPDSQVYI